MQLAEAAGVTARTIHRLEIGGVVHVTPKKRHGHGEVRAIAFSPDGRRIVSGSHDQTLRLWDPGSWSGASAETGQSRVLLEGHRGEVSAVAFSLDGRRIV